MPDQPTAKPSTTSSPSPDPEDSRSSASTERVALIYPKDVSERPGLDLVTMEQARGSLAGLFRERCQRSPNKVAYREFEPQSGVWREYRWQDMAQLVARWTRAFTSAGLNDGDRVAIRVKNCHHWVAFDQAALGLGLVVVPLYTADRGDNVAYVVDHSDSRFVFVENSEMIDEFLNADFKLPFLEKIVVLEPFDTGGSWRLPVSQLEEWLGDASDESYASDDATPPVEIQTDKLASIVYTSGTTGRPKGVMLSHGNILSDCVLGMCSIEVRPSDLFVSFLPLSHTLERSVGYYVPMIAGATVAYARSIADLPQDLLDLKPTVIISVPRIFERVYGRVMDSLEQSGFRKRLFHLAVDVGWERFEYLQGRGKLSLRSKLLWPILDKLVASKLAARLGGRLRIAVCGGAPLPGAVGKAFCALGLPILQGYGLTESSPSLSINTIEQNIPWSIGLPLRGIDLKLGDNDELLAKGPNIMLGYWKNEEATREAIDEGGWLHTGDIARIENGFVYITGRIKDIIVLSNGEKLPPADMENAIARDALFEQIMILGEGRSFLSVIVVLNEDLWPRAALSLGVRADDPEVLQSKAVQEALLERVRLQINDFPGYARIYQITATLEPWTVENGLTTPTLKIKRPQVMERFDKEIASMYDGH